MSHSLPEQEPGFEGGAPTRSSRWWIGGGVLLLILLALLWTRACKGTSDKAAGARPVPIIAATARQGEMSLNLSALGTVTPLNTVTVRSRVDGQLLRVAFTEGQFVKEGDLLAEIDPRPFQVQLMQAEGQLAKDQAAQTNALADQRRLQTLVQQGIISRQQLDTQNATVDQFTAAMKADQAQVESAKLNLVYSRITAPISGKVGLRMVDPGNMVRASDASSGLAVIAPLQPINVVFTIASDDIQQVLAKTRAGQKLPAEAWDRDQRKLLATGNLIAIDNQVDPATGTVRMKALFSNEDAMLFPNQFVNIRLRIDTLQGMVLVPAASLQRSPQGTFLYVVAQGNTAEMRPVEVRATEGETAAIGKGLKPGELVVIEGMEKLRPGASVTLPATEPRKGEKAK
jgi:multidrug efflux system membrane fusion protein